MTTPYRLFFLDDNGTDIKLLRAHLSQSGPWVISCFERADEALSNLAAHPYDIYIIDLNLGEQMAGEIVASKLKELSTYRKTAPIVFYTQLVTLREVRRNTAGGWYKIGSEYYIGKSTSSVNDLSQGFLEILKDAAGA